MKKQRRRLPTLVLCILAVFLFIPPAQTEAAKSKEYTEGNYKYKIKNEEVIITKYIGNEDVVNVPSMLAGKPVTAIGNYAFLSDDIKEIIVPDGVTSLGESCFENNTKLQKVTLPEGITEIPWDAFYDCENLKEAILPSSVRKISYNAFCNCSRLRSVGRDLVLDEVDEDSFYLCKELETTITLTEKCKAVPAGCFGECKKLRFVFEGSLENVGDSAFRNCKQLTSIAFSDNLKTIGFSSKGRNQDIFLDGTVDDYLDQLGYYTDVLKKYFNMQPFYGCDNLEEIVVNDTNPYFTWKNGVLYNKDKSCVLYVIPKYSGSMDFLKDVTYIGSYAFMDSRLKCVELPDNIKGVYEAAFLNSKTKKVKWSGQAPRVCSMTFYDSEIETLVLPEGVKYIDWMGVEHCNKLKKLVLPSTLLYIDTDDEFIGVLSDLPALEEIRVAKGGKWFCSKDGVLVRKIYEGDSLQYVLAKYPSAKKGKTYVVPKKFEVANGCFDRLKYLKNIVLQEGGEEETLRRYVWNSKNVTVRLPRSIKYFKTEYQRTFFNLFFDCEDCTVLVYKDSPAYKYYKQGKNLPKNCKYKVISEKKKKK